MKIFTTLFGNNKKPSAGEAEDKTVSAMPDREKQVYESDLLTRQRLYEKWVSKDEWLLKSEGIYLLAGVDPADASIMHENITELWNHARECVNKGLLPVINNELSEQEWRVKPSDLYSWATVSRIPVPAELTELMEFVLQTIKATAANVQQPINVNNDKEQNYLRHREIVMGASLALIADEPQRFCTRGGKLSSRLIAAEITANAVSWFKNEEPLLAQPAMEDLIESYLKMSVVSKN